MTKQDTVKVSERLVGKKLYSAFQLLCITICITTKETNFLSASTPRVEHERLSRGKDMEILFALQSTDYESVVIARIKKASLYFVSENIRTLGKTKVTTVSLGI